MWLYFWGKFRAHEELCLSTVQCCPSEENVGKLKPVVPQCSEITEGSLHVSLQQADVSAGGACFLMSGIFLYW